MGDTDKCLLCDKNLTDGKTVNVKQKGLNTLIKSSESRKDGKSEILKGLSSVVVHVSCRKNYTREDSIKAALKTITDSEATTSSPIKDKLRSSIPCFDFKSTCLYCAEAIDAAFYEKEKKKEVSKRLKVHRVQTLQVRGSIVEAAGKRGDKWAREVKQRLEGISDLVAVEAIYHERCSVNFFKKPNTGAKGGRPPVSDVTSAMDVIFDAIENSDDCQFSMPDLISLLKDYVPSELTIKKKLKEKFGDELIIATNKKKTTTICFRNTGYQILSSHWYEQKKVDEREERLRVVTAAAAIIREDIRSQINDTSAYPSSDDFLKDVQDCIPESLDVFLENVIAKGRKCQSEPLQRKCISIAHAIILATRPRSFLSPLLISVAAFLYRKFGSKNLVMLLSSLGFSASYNEAQLLEASASIQPDAEISIGGFCQFVFDNADFNVCTIDGFNTFHSMGGIKCVTPCEAILPKPAIARITKIPTAKEFGKQGVISLKSFENVDGKGLKNILIGDLPGLEYLKENVQLPSLSDVLWMCGKFGEVANIPGWRGFMKTLNNERKFERSRVICLPFVNSPPSSYDTIYTVLCAAVEESRRLGVKTTFVTFDQPLYVKARDIVAAMGQDSDLGSVVPRLGGFHLLMSFLGTIGFIMAGSGLKDLLSVIYAPLSVEKMLSGHAYARAIRGHLLVQLALAKIILQEMDLNIDEREAVRDILHDFNHNPPTLASIATEPSIRQIHEKFTLQLQKTESKSPTAKLWIQYFNMVTLIKQFIQSEREGDWTTHLQIIQNMLPFFHASGHFLYAKACHLYLQDMFNLETHMDTEEYRKFVEEGFFTIRRTDKFWSGTWSDMVIEQTLMRSMKVVGGITGRGFTDSILGKWTLAMPAHLDICDKLEQFCDLSFVSGEQHVDSRESRMKRDNEDVERLQNWLSCHDPFPVSDGIFSISTGVVGDKTIDCHNALEIGVHGIKKLIGNNFKDVKFKRVDRVHPLATVNSAIKIHDTIVPVDPLLLFQRIVIAKKDDEQLVDYLEYELAPYPLSLFNDAGMRKTKKSALYDILEESRDRVNLNDCRHVIDGGFLLHRVIWHQNQTYRSICDAYINYVKNNFGATAIIVFDGYNNSASSTKTAEQSLRSIKHTSADVLFDETMTATVTQEKFLGNEKNKTRLISMLSEKFEIEGFIVKQATDDADTLIVRTAIEVSSSEKTVIVGEDVDLLVLITALAPQERNIYFVKPGRGKAERKIYCSQTLQSQEGLQDIILFAHAFSGCDTTSCLFQKGKLKCLKLLRQRKDLREVVAKFNDDTASQDDIARAGERFFMAIYGAPGNETSLNRHRYNLFAKSAYKSKPNLASLPPTAAAAQQHSFRVYLQVQKWRGNEKCPELWGWKKVNDRLKPVLTLKAPAPESLLTLISCNCKKGCTSSCGCRKAGLKCAAICGYCHGTSCLNSIPTFDTEKESSVERDLDENDFFVIQDGDRDDEFANSQPDETAEKTLLETATPTTSRVLQY